MWLWIVVQRVKPGNEGTRESAAAETEEQTNEGSPREGGPFVYGKKLGLAGKRARCYCWGVVVEDGGVGFEVEPEVELPELELPKAELPTGLEVLLAG